MVNVKSVEVFSEEEGQDGDPEERGCGDEFGGADCLYSARDPGVVWSDGSGPSR
jgi:hypothetical protein